jgi:2-polyprenyl-6-methoxyphenol hydroxylase-like FAD-dependent oxidoreductase
VIGASVAGLLAAAALSGTCQQVTVYDRDSLPAEPGPRRGVPQSRQLHVLHARGVAALDDLLPGLREDLIAAGGIVADLQGDAHWYLDDYLLKPARSGLEGIGLGRPLLEWAIRARVAALPGVAIVGGTDVVGLVTADDRVRGVRVRAARTREAAEETVTASLVVDAAGRGSRTPVWLTELGREAPRISRVRPNVSYVSRYYRRDPRQLDGRLATLVTTYPGRPFGGAVVSQEGMTWLVLLSGMIGFELPFDQAGMIALADRLSCPDVATVMRESEPLSEALRYTFPESTRYHYEDLRDHLSGLLIIGDALSSFNPVYGQGITVAALEALILRDLVTAAESGPGGLERRYFQATGKLVAQAWETSASNDLRFPEVEGKRRPGTGLLSAYGAKLRAAASVDPVIGATFLSVANMTEKPVKLLSPGVMLRVFRSAGKAVKASDNK